MNDSQLRAFVEVASCGSFSKAADKLFLSKQALKKQIDALEHELGFTLMVRSSKGILLTPSGERFLRGSKNLLGDFALLIDETRAITTSQSVINIRTFDNPKIILEAAINEFARQRPAVQQKISFKSDFNYVDDVLSGQVDVAQCIYSPELNRKELNFLPLYTQGYRCLMVPSHPLAQKTCLQIEDLNGYHLGLYIPRNQPLMELLKERIPDLSVEEIRDSSLQSIFTHCYSGNIFVSRAYFVEEMTFLTSLPLDTPFTFESGILYRRNASPLVKDFVRIAQETFPRK